MTSAQYALLNLTRNRRRTVLLTLLLALIFFGEMICFALSGAASRGEKEAFVYNGEAFQVEFDSYEEITDELREQVLSIDHARGISSLADWHIHAEGICRSEAHTGYTVGADLTKESNANRFVLIGDIDVSMLNRFQRDACVSLTEGAFPTKENPGLLVESRVAEENGLRCGDKVTFASETGGASLTLPVCGIYKVDSDYEIASPEDYDYSYDKEDPDFDVYNYSPYNYIYTDRDTVSAVLGEPEMESATLSVYVDAYENADAVASQLKALLGDDREIYDNVTGYLENFGSLLLVGNLSGLISRMVFFVGTLLTLIAMTYFAVGFQFECGLMMVLGQHRRTVICRYLLLVGLMILGAAVAALALYLAAGPLLLRSVADAANAYANGSDETIGFYTAALSQPFAMTADVTDLFTPATLWKLAGTAALLLAVTALLPVWCVFRTRPRRLLE